MNGSAIRGRLMPYQHRTLPPPGASILSYVSKLGRKLCNRGSTSRANKPLNFADGAQETLNEALDLVSKELDAFRRADDRPHMVPS